MIRLHTLAHNLRIVYSFNTCKVCKQMYNTMRLKKEICTSVSKWRERGSNYLFTAWNKIVEP